jgi:hypothetical protein
MATITFDTYKYINRLKAAGLSEQQAAEVVAVVAEAHDSLEVATKGDLKDLATKDGLRKLELELAVVKWMLGTVIGGIVALVMKAFLL